ncbi:MAG: restriction endonuclease subunit S, partial [Burkholderiales bacterium]
MNKDTATLLEQYFDTAFNAADGIKKLRELILTLAMQGKLVPQDPSDPPASELLKEIEAEKKRLVKEGKIKTPKPLPPVTEAEKPYELPQGWEWVRFPYCYYGIGSKSNQIQTSGYQESGTYPVIDQGKTFIAAYTDVKELLLKLDKPVIVFGDHTKNIKYVDFDFIIGADGVKTLCPYDSIASKFLFRLMQSYNLADRGYARHFGV